jgi:hypothetical protein
MYPYLSPILLCHQRNLNEAVYKTLGGSPRSSLLISTLELDTIELAVSTVLLIPIFTPPSMTDMLRVTRSKNKTNTQDSTTAMPSMGSSLFHEEVDRAANHLGQTEHNLAPALTKQISDLLGSALFASNLSQHEKRDTQHRRSANMSYDDRGGKDARCVVQDVIWERRRYGAGQVIYPHRG